MGDVKRTIPFKPGELLVVEIPHASKGDLDAVRADLRARLPADQPFVVSGMPVTVQRLEREPAAGGITVFKLGDTAAGFMPMQEDLEDFRQVVQDGEGFPGSLITHAAVRIEQLEDRGGVALVKVGDSANGFAATEKELSEMDAVVEGWQERGMLPQTMCLVVPDTVTFDRLDDAQLARLGLVRKA